MKKVMHSSFKTVTLTLLTLLFIGSLITVKQTLFIPSLEKSFDLRSMKLPKEIRQLQRSDYMNMLLRDPKTGEIPKYIRAKELSFSKELKTNPKYKSLAAEYDIYKFVQSGPYDVGGRTRAIALDINNSSNLVAGGVSGGIWKSTDGGNTWDLKTPDFQNLAVTSIAQNPVSGKTNEWYAVTGEFLGSSAAARLGSAFHYGTGVYKSDDNAETWYQLDISDNGNKTVWDSEYDFMTRIVVSPTTGSVFFSNNGDGIFKSDDGGATVELVLGDIADFYHSDVAVATNGDLLAILATGNDSSPTIASYPGIWRSTDDGQTWQDVTPSNFPTTHARSIATFAPSAPHIAYVLTNAKNAPRLFHFDFDAGTTADRTNNLPNFGSPAGDVNLQGGYNMAIAIKPDDPEFVLIGATNLYRSFDGYQTVTAPSSPTSTDRDKHWIGGYRNTNTGYSLYSNHHPDQHAIIFVPDNPNAVYSAHDGGISFTNNILDTQVSWQDKNDGYFITQFYTVSFQRKETNGLILGGTQDNGSPFFVSGNSAIPSDDLSSGDGSYAFIGSSKLYTSSQNGYVLRYAIDPNTKFPTIAEAWVHPSAASNQFFIHPFAVDPINETTMYYPDGTNLFRNMQAGTLSNASPSGTTTGWDMITNNPIAEDGTKITALAVSTTPEDILYFGATDTRRPASIKSAVYRITNASTAQSIIQKKLFSTLPAGSFIHDFGINEANANELLVGFSNYNIDGIQYSNDGGQTFTSVTGNLSGNTQNPGPSVRSVAIINVKRSTVYIAGTSIGLFATETLYENNTVWIQQSPDVLGNSIVAALDSRDSDGKVIAATHGRGAFLGTPDELVSITDNRVEIPVRTILNQNYPNPFNPVTQISFTLSTTGSVTLNVYDLNGKKVSTLLNNENRTAGNHTITFNGRNLASGTYFYRIDVSGDVAFTQTRTMTLIK